MKTEYKPIAMRCTQEQFDGIKDRITLPIENIGSFEVFEYLVIRDYYVTNTTKEVIYYETKETYKTFDGELFLDCCGREVEVERLEISNADKQQIIDEYLKDKVLKGSGMQFFLWKWMGIYLLEIPNQTPTQLQRRN